MEQETELSDYATVHEIGITETHSSDTKQSERRLLKIGIVFLGVLCIVQAALNISLRLAFNSKEDTDQFPFNSSVIADMCQTEQSQQNSTQFCSCCNKLLRRLLREYQALETERDRLRNKVIQMDEDKTGEEQAGSGEGSGEEFFFSEISGDS